MPRSGCSRAVKRRHRSVRSRRKGERSTGNFRNVRERKGTPWIEDEDGLIIYTGVQLRRECDNKRFDVYERACWYDTTFLGQQWEIIIIRISNRKSCEALPRSPFLLIPSFAEWPVSLRWYVLSFQRYLFEYPHYFPLEWKIIWINIRTCVFIENRNVFRIWIKNFSQFV